jgi:sec-independent protein translocase protein TatC
MLIGGAFGYKVIFKFGFPFFLSILGEGTEANISIASYLSSSTKLLVGFGLCFQLPIVVFLMSRMGLINAHDMISKFRYAIVLIFVISALMTPPDPMTQALMAVPMTILYCLSIGVSYLFSTKTPNDEE